MTQASPTIRIRALRELDVDNVRIAEGEEADIRRDLVAALVACGAADDEVEQPAPPAPAQTNTMPGQTEGEERLASVDPSAATDAAPAAVSSAEPITEAEAGPVSAEGQAATPGDANAASAAEGKAGEAAGASNHDAAVGGTEAQPAAPAAAVSVGGAPVADAPPAGRSGKKR